jgi:hypothetical protein
LNYVVQAHRKILLTRLEQLVFEDSWAGNYYKGTSIQNLLQSLGLFETMEFSRSICGDEFINAIGNVVNLKELKLQKAGVQRSLKLSLDHSKVEILAHTPFVRNKKFPYFGGCGWQLCISSAFGVQTGAFRVQTGAFRVHLEFLKIQMYSFCT